MLFLERLLRTELTRRNHGVQVRTIGLRESQSLLKFAYNLDSSGLLANSNTGTCLIRFIYSSLQNTTNYQQIRNKIPGKKSEKEPYASESFLLVANKFSGNSSISFVERSLSTAAIQR